MPVFIDNIKAVGKAAWHDFCAGDLKDKALLAGTGTFLIAHEFGMENALFYTGTHVYETTGSPGAVSLALGAMSMATETALTFGMSESIERFEEATEEVESRYYISQINEPDKPSRKHRIRSALDTASLAIILGSPGVILRGYAKNPEKTYKENVKTGLKASASLAAFNATFTAGITGWAPWLAERFGANSVSDFVVGLERSPIGTGIVAAYVVSRLVSVSRQNKKIREQLAVAGEETSI